MKRRRFLLGVNQIDPIYDGVDVMYTLRRPAMTTLWTNAVLQLRRDSDNQTAYVFFDGSSVNATITLDSFISTSSNTTPSATTLGDWVGSNSAAVRQWIGITDDNTIDANKTISQTSSTAAQPLFVNVGGVLKWEGHPYVNFSSATQYLRGTANAVLNSGNDFTVTTTTFSFNNSTVQTYLTTGTNVLDRFSMFNDRTTNKRLGIIRNSGSTNYITTYLSQQDTNAIRTQTVEVEGTDLRGYLENVSQNDVTWSGSYSNQNLTLGMDTNSQTPLQGGILEIIIWDSILT